jgi:DNA-binding MarR family transcriptional regulator
MGISSARVNVGAPSHPEQAELGEAELGAWRGLVRVHAALVRELDAELDTRHGLPLSSYEVLRCLSRAPGGRLRMAELAEHVLLSRSGMTRLIDRLEREGMVCRSSCDKDGRGCYAGLTDLGRDTVEQARTTHIAVVRDGFLRHFSEDEMRGLATMFERVLPRPA